MNSIISLSAGATSRARSKMRVASQRALIIAAVVALAAGVAFPQGGESVDVQRARAKMIATKRDKVYYTNKFDLDGLPHYKPEQKVSGTIRLWGLNYLTDGNVAKYWEQGFRKYHPDVKIEYNTPSALV